MNLWKRRDCGKTRVWKISVQSVITYLFFRLISVLHMLLLITGRNIRFYRWILPWKTNFCDHYRKHWFRPWYNFSRLMNCVQWYSTGIVHLIWTYISHCSSRLGNKKEFSQMDSELPECWLETVSSDNVETWNWSWSWNQIVSIWNVIWMSCLILNWKFLL